MVCGAKCRLWLKKVFLCIGFIILVVGIFTGCGDPEAADVIEQEKDLSDNATQVPFYFYFDETNFSFYYPPSLAEGISTQIIDGHWLYCPEYKLISFDNYLLSDTSYNAHIMLTPLKEFLLQCDWAEEEMNRLESILAKKDIPDNRGDLFYLPEGNAFQVFEANIEFFESKASSGVRYLTQFTQIASPLIDNLELTYIYLGITSDHKYYFTAAFPVNYSELPRHNEDYLESTGIDYTDWDSWEEIYGDYLDVTVQLLDAAAAENFEPSLLLLDDIIKSFQIE